MVGIVDTHHMGVVARDFALDRRSDAPTRFVVDIIPLDVLIANERPWHADLTSIPVGLHEPAGSHGIPEREAIVVRRGEPARPRRPGPDPPWPEHAGNQRLARTGWRVDEQVRLGELACANRLEVLAQQIDVPRVDEWDGWLEDAPRLLHEVMQPDLGMRVSRRSPRLRFDETQVRGVLGLRLDRLAGSQRPFE